VGNAWCPLPDPTTLFVLVPYDNFVAQMRNTVRPHTCFVQRQQHRVVAFGRDDLGTRRMIWSRSVTSWLAMLEIRRAFVEESLHALMRVLAGESGVQLAALEADPFRQ